MDYLIIEIGLSPLARGTRETGRGRLSTDAVYPRWRGEHLSKLWSFTTTSGLSPLARGTLISNNRSHAVYRFIPAGAGNTPSPSLERDTYSVYPRWRGEHHIGVGLRNLWSGLSPLARGTRLLLSVFQAGARFIPAGAGNTYQAPVAALTGPVYPRWRGEHCVYWLQIPVCIGLSPLARGTRLISFLLLRLQRFIPAGAGNTPGLRTALNAAAVYPRWRGEHNGEVPLTIRYRGLSPLARGTL